MNINNARHRACVALLAVAVAALAPCQASAQTLVEPRVGQPGKDTVWVPTPAELVEKMLDMAKVTQEDFVIDLGSGDGRNVIAAARRGARALGVEFNPDLVRFSEQRAKEAGVADKARFVEGDMFEADISSATVLALFLLPDNLIRLTPRFLALKPGTRIVLNTFGIEGWEPDAVEDLGGKCQNWCSSLLYIVPAEVRGTWRVGDNALTLTQEFQNVSGALASRNNRTEISNGRLRGDQLSFKLGEAEYSGRVEGNRIEGVITGGGREQAWTATRQN